MAKSDECAWIFAERRICFLISLSIRQNVFVSVMLRFMCEAIVNIIILMLYGFNYTAFVLYDLV